MPMTPATEALTAFERLRIDNTFDLMKRFRSFSPERKSEVLQQLAGHAPRLYAEVLRLEDVLLPLTVERDNLRKMLEDANAREELQTAVTRKLWTVIRLVVDKMGCSIPPCDGISGRPCEIHQAIADLTEPPPAPMCKPDPLHDIFPATGEGRPT